MKSNIVPTAHTIAEKTTVQRELVVTGLPVGPLLDWGVQRTLVKSFILKTSGGSKSQPIFSISFSTNVSDFFFF